MANPGILFPLIALGAAVLFLGGSGEVEQTPAPVPPVPVPPVPPPPSAPHSPRTSLGVQFQMLAGNPDHVYHLPVSIIPSAVVVLFSEFEEEHPDGTRTQLCHASAANSSRSECIWLAEPPLAILEALGMPQGQFVKVHQRLGKTDPRPGWDDDTTEVVPMWINRAHIQMIGPSPILDTKRRRLGKIYTKNGIDFDLYESFDQLQELVGSGIKVISEKFRPRELR